MKKKATLFEGRKKEGTKKQNINSNVMDLN